MANGCDNRIQSMSSLRIAVIDDDTLVLNMLCEMLEYRGNRVECFASPVSALMALEETQYDAIVCDIQMPDMNGIEFFLHLTTAHPRYNHRIIFLTGDIFALDTQRFLAQVGCLCLCKPFRRAALENALLMVMAGDAVDADQTDLRKAA